MHTQGYFGEDRQRVRCKLRERIRQIEKNALRKLQRNVNNTKLNIINQYANMLLQKFEGIV